VSQTDRQSIAELSLTPPAAGTHKTAGPLDMDNAKSASPPPYIPLFEPNTPADRPRILIVDDNAVVLEGMRNSLHQYARALDARFWLAEEGQTDLIGHLGQMASAPTPWRPQVVVLDIHMKGRTGLDYLQALRAEPGLAALAAVLATADHKRDLDRSYLIENPAAQTATEWLSQARAHEPEFVLYGKTGSANFLLRVGESASSWIQAARRRAWQKLLDAVAEHLDGKLENDDQIKELGDLIARYAHDELDVDEAFVRWRQDGERYELIAQRGALKHVRVGDSTAPNETPLLTEVLTSPRTSVIKAHVKGDALGRYQQVTDYRFLGISATLDERPYGFIALYRRPDKAEFDPFIDGKPLAILGRLLAAALGRATAIKRTQARQQALLSFAEELARQKTDQEVFHSLATFLHREVHGDDPQGKVAIAQINFESGILTCIKPTAGLDAAQCKLPVFVDGPGICALTIRTCAPILIDDVTAPEWQGRYTESTPSIRSELCVPLLISGAAVGVVNLEHLSLKRYKVHDMEFVQSAANLASQVLDNLRTSAFAESMLAFAEDYARLPSPQAEQSLRDRLHAFCRFSALATLEPSDPTDLTQVWRLVGEVDFRLAGGLKEALTQSLQDLTDWNDTWLHTLCATKAWEGNQGVSFTKEPRDFRPVTLFRQNDQDVGQKADAVLWVRHGDAPPKRAILLLWVFPPLMGGNEIQALGRFAELFSSLEAQQDRVRSLRDQILLSEQAAALGHVMQHFRHRLVNQTGAMAGLVELLEDDLHRGRQALALEALEHLKASVRATANAFGKAQAYVKRLEPQRCLLTEVVADARTDLGSKLASVAWDDQGIHADTCCWTDPVIVGLILYSLLENAADAQKGQADALIRLSARMREDWVELRVEDKGTGISADIRDRLFTFGLTTKAGSLGSALAFARVRAAQLGAELRLASPQPQRGAAFELLLPANETSWAHATTPVYS